MAKKTIIKSTILIFALTIIAKAIGFGKSIIMASYFGADLNSDAYYFSSTLVANVLYMITASIGISFLPIYVKIRETDGRERSSQYTAETLIVMLGIAIILTALVIIAAPLLITIFAPTYTGQQFDTTVLYLRIMAGGIIFALLTNIFLNLLNGEKVFGFSNISGIINSVVLILMIVVLSPRMGIMSAVLALPISYVAQFLTLSFRGRKFVDFRLKRNPWNESTKILLIQALPILLSNATIELNQMIDKMLLVSIEDGAVSAIHYSSVLFQFATSIVSLPISTVIFTELSELVARNELDTTRRLIKNTLHAAFLIGVPVTLVMLIYTGPIINIVFGHGHFSDYAVSRSAIGLFYYGFCLIPTCIKQVMTKAFYSVHDTKIPMILSILEVTLNIGASILLSRFMGLAGVVCGTAVATITFSIIQIAVFSKKKVFLEFKTEWNVYLKLMLCTAIAGVSGYYVSLALPQNILGFVILSVLVFAIFYIILYLMKDKMLKVMMNKGKSIIRKKIGKRS